MKIRMRFSINKLMRLRLNRRKLKTKKAAKVKEKVMKSPKAMSFLTRIKTQQTPKSKENLLGRKDSSRML